MNALESVYLKGRKRICRPFPFYFFAGHDANRTNTVMAISENLIFKNVSGHLNKEIVFKQYAGKTVVAKYPDMSHRTLSEKQLKVNELMMEANYNAKAILANEQLRIAAQARLNVTRNKLYTALIREYFKNVV